MRAADASILPSDWENFPHAAVEALAAETPVIATAVGGVPEIVESGVNGILVPPRDPDALAAAMARVSEDDELWRVSAPERSGRASAIARTSSTGRSRPSSDGWSRRRMAPRTSLFRREGPPRPEGERHRRLGAAPALAASRLARGGTRGPNVRPRRRWRPGLRRPARRARGAALADRRRTRPQSGAGRVAVARDALRFAPISSTPTSSTPISTGSSPPASPGSRGFRRSTAPTTSTAASRTEARRPSRDARPG